MRLVNRGTARGLTVGNGERPDEPSRGVLRASNHLLSQHVTPRIDTSEARNRWGVGMSDVTRILNAIEQGDPKATDELLPLVYEELRLLAAQKLSHEPPGQTLEATALVHEADLRLDG